MKSARRRWLVRMVTVALSKPRAIDRKPHEAAYPKARTRADRDNDVASAALEDDDHGSERHLLEPGCDVAVVHDDAAEREMRAPALPLRRPPVEADATAERRVLRGQLALAPR